MPKVPPLLGDDLDAAIRLILDCYDRMTLEQFTYKKLNLRFEWIVRNAGLAHQVAELFDFAGRHRLTGKLLKELAEYPPTNVNKDRLKPLAEKYPPEQSEADRLVSDLIGETIDGFTAVPELLQEPAIRELFTPFKSAYQEAASQIDLLRRFKGLHDCLHIIQLKFGEIVQSAENFIDDELEASNLNIYADDLEVALSSDGINPGIDALISGLANPGRETTWVKNLRRAIELLRDAATSHIHSPAADAIRQLKRILVRDPDRIHGEIVKQSEKIELRSLVFSIRAIHENVSVEAVRKKLFDGMVALESIDLMLSSLVAEHTAWQNLDNSLLIASESWYELLSLERRRVEERVPVAASADGVASEDEDSQTVYANRLLEDWPDVAEKFSEVLAHAAQERRLERLIRYAQVIEEAKQTREFGLVFDSFEPFAKQALRQFVSVDRKLVTLCDELARIAEPLRAVLEVLKE